MGECGCTSSDRRYTFPAPGEAFYILTLHGHCRNCCSPAGITIELIESGHILWDAYKRGEFITGPLAFEQWPDNQGAGIVIGMTKEEFVKALSRHLVGMSSNDLCDNGVVDDIAAEVILDEMYADAQFCPKLYQHSCAACGGNGTLPDQSPRKAKLMYIDWTHENADTGNVHVFEIEFTVTSTGSRETWEQPADPPEIEWRAQHCTEIKLYYEIPGSAFSDSFFVPHKPTDAESVSICKWFEGLDDDEHEGLIQAILDAWNEPAEPDCSPDY